LQFSASIYSCCRCTAKKAVNEIEGVHQLQVHLCVMGHARTPVVNVSKVGDVEHYNDLLDECYVYKAIVYSFQDLRYYTQKHPFIN